jgi:hypothetical protein
MSNDKYFDFDQYMEERNGGTFTIKAFGKEYQIPNDVPFDVILTISRAFKSGKQNMSEEETVKMTNTIFGEETFAEWLKKGIGLKGIMILTEQVMKMYMDNASDVSNDIAGEKSKNHPTP